MIEVLADPGSCWRIPGEPWSESQRRMREMIDGVASAGAHGLKCQLLRKGMYRDGTAAAALVGQYEIPDDWLPWLRDECEARGLEFLITAYRAEDVALIDPYVKRHKVAGFDAHNAALIEAIAETGKPLILTFSLGNHEKSVAYPRSYIPDGSVALHGTSQYPTPPQNMNLAFLRSVIERTGSPWGLSDHSIGSTAAIMAVAFGASLIEKHVRHRETPPENPDYAAAMPLDQLVAYVGAIQEAELMLGDGVKRVMPGEWTHYAYDRATGRRAGD